MITFIKIDGVNGGSAEHPNYRNWIKVDSYEYAVNQTLERSTLGVKTHGKADWSALVIKKNCDVSTPQLANLCASGSYLKSAQIDVLQCEDAKDISSYQCVLRIAFEQLFMIGYKNYLSERDGQALEEICLYYGKIKWEYISKNAGKRDSALRAGWDIERNQSIS